MTLDQVALDYFRAFASRDLDRVMEFFSDQAHLRDWEVSAHSKEEIRSINGRIFESVTSISVLPRTMVCNGNVVMAEIDIHIDSTVTLRVVDLLEFDVNQKIIAIRAFKG